jgi:hypothetical protein
MNRYKETMRRMSCLLLFTLFASVAAAAGYDDSRDTKQALTYQVDSGDYDYSMEVSALDAELPVELIVAAPYLGLRTPTQATLTTKASVGFGHVARPPPDSYVSKITFN